MAYNRQNTSDNGTRIITFYYTPTSLFRKAQMLSQYHANANKDKEGNPNLDLVLSDDHKEWFDSFCTKAVETLGATYIKVNHKLDIPYYYFSSLKEACHIKVTDYGFVKDTLLSVLDEVIEKAIVDYVLFKWYDQKAFVDLEKLFGLSFDNAMIHLRTELFQFLRKGERFVYKIMFSDAYCVQEMGTSVERSIKWSEPMCVQNNFKDFSIEWSDAYCTQKSPENITIKWSDAYCKQIANVARTIKWSEPMCVQKGYDFNMKWSDPSCVQVENKRFELRWHDPLCVQSNNMLKTIKWSEPMCVQQAPKDISIKWTEAYCVQKPLDKPEIKWSDPYCAQSTERRR